MQQVVLGQTGRTTSRLGYGCSSILGGLSRRDSMRMLDAAFDAGIRHFDVAPLYGFGEAEAGVGEFLARHPGVCTVTTKFGLKPESPHALKQALRSLARPVMKMLPGLQRKLSKPVAALSAQAVAPSHSRPPLSSADAQASLEVSLRNLRSSRIDVFLLHEAELADTTGDSGAALLRVLEDAVQRGDIGTFGVGSDRVKAEAIYRAAPEFCPVAQFEWSVVDEPVPEWPVFRIHHRALRESFDPLAAWLERNPAVSKSWSSELGFDLRRKETLGRLMLKAALAENPSSIVLFSTKQPKRVAANVAIAEDESLEAPSRRLYELVRAVRREVCS